MAGVITADSLKLSYFVITVGALGRLMLVTGMSAVTVTFVEAPMAPFDSETAIMVAAPAATPVTTPFESTVAAFGLDELQMSFLFTALSG
ncbi:hypothetical protein D3C73_1510400 [compost metagenome]